MGLTAVRKVNLRKKTACVHGFAPLLMKVKTSVPPCPGPVLHHRNIPCGGPGGGNCLRVQKKKGTEPSGSIPYMVLHTSSWGR